MDGAPGGEVVVYEDPVGEVRVDVRLERETIWLSQRQMADLFDTSTDNVGLHLRNVFAEGELAEAATTEEYSAVQIEGRRKVRRMINPMHRARRRPRHPPRPARVADALALLGRPGWRCFSDVTSP